MHLPALEKLVPGRWYYVAKIIKNRYVLVDLH